MYHYGGDCGVVRDRRSSQPQHAGSPPSSRRPARVVHESHDDDDDDDDDDGYPSQFPSPPLPGLAALPPSPVIPLAMVDRDGEEGRQSRTACTECQRRKQKCNREWPCDHCRKRKVADKCRFPQSKAAADKAAVDVVGRKRHHRHHDPLAASRDTNPWDDDDGRFEALGYSPSHLFSGLNAAERRARPTVKLQKECLMGARSCPQLERALKVLPPRPYTDMLVQNFVNKVNYHYYMVYPPSFLDDYRAWWAERCGDRPMSLQWTCLLLTICACSAQHADPELQHKLESDLGEGSIRKLAERYHGAARELHSVIPIGNNHLLNVQSLLHSCYWYQSEASFVESWHVLSAAIREAQGLGFHQESVAGDVPEFDCEIRRRLWCILDTWDWHLSALLSRPMIIDRTECDVGFPTLKLEGYSPSPLLHMKLQSQLITRIARRFGLPKDVVTPADVREYQAMVEGWMRTFPPTYDLRRADESADAQRPWIVPHRHHLRSMAYLIVLDPLRPYLARHLSARSPPEELEIRRDGVDYSLHLMSALHRFFDHVYPRDAKFHAVLFYLFDTAAVLCSALLHDDDASIPRRRDILAAIDKAVAALERLRHVTETAKTSYEVILRVSRRATGKYQSEAHDDGRARIGCDEDAVATPNMSHGGTSTDSDPGTVGSCASYSSLPPSFGPVTGAVASHATTATDTSISSEGLFLYPPTSNAEPSVCRDGLTTASAPDPLALASFAWHEPQAHSASSADDVFYAQEHQPFGFGDISQVQLGNLASLWNYASLNLDFLNPPDNG
ncbi:hypothetical protein RJ55_01969 [Drechmeria coniospora]|nr:hypothetical protein RJ55_01969 [Drechmeria coniospora]